MRLVIVTLGLAVVLIGVLAVSDWAFQSTGHVEARPLILEQDEGEHRLRRPRDVPMPPLSFTIKVDRFNGGSRKMWLGTEELAPGGVIQRHRHLGQDEIVLIETGTAHVSVGAQERDVHPGAMLFIPSGTWISLKNVGSENMNLVFVFSDPGFDDYLRCTSVPAGQAPSRVTPEELSACRRRGHLETLR